MNKAIHLTYLLIISWLYGFAQIPSNDVCLNAVEIEDSRSYCSESPFTNENATPSYAGNDKDVWFKFVARNFEIKITVNGTGGARALQSPVIQVYNNCGNTVTQRTAPTVIDGNTTIFNDAGLIPGQVYYVAVSGAGGGTGTFGICIENYQSEIKPGQDFATASLLCNTESIIREINVNGSGVHPNETVNTCIGEEKHSAWYTWAAANNGTLVFTITPTDNDDIDWVLFELGPEGNTELPAANNIVRCAAGHGIDNEDCPDEPTYTQTGLDFNETDVTEEGGCGSGQNGMLQFLTMKEGFVYALIVNNFSEGHNGFEIAFTDRAGQAGTGLFKGPDAQILFTPVNACTPQQSFMFDSEVSNYASLKWYFGEGSNIEQADTEGPFYITYSSPGLKTVVLQVESDQGCTIVKTQTFNVDILPDPPVISVNKPDFCIDDIIRLSTPEQANVTYSWIGPAGFHSDLREPEIPVTGVHVSGSYTLIISRGSCSTIAESIQIPPVLNKPEAAFSTEPGIPSQLAFPITVSFFNESQNADSYLWDFGDGTSSTEVNPIHTYDQPGKFDVKLTAYQSNVCFTSVLSGSFTLSAPGTIFIPNTFTPNGDGINDRFFVNMTNTKAYRISIYNRYGVHLYVSDNINQHWDGTYKNEHVPVGTYYYIIDAIDQDNNTVRKSGSVTVLR